jgi:hypothetical protein
VLRMVKRVSGPSGATVARSMATGELDVQM